MRLWPFPKKSDSEFDNAGMDLPDGVMLAAPDSEPQGGASVPTQPSYRTRGEEEPLLDPAAALETPAESQPFSPLVANSDNPALDDAFNKLFMDGAPSLALPQSDTPAQPFLEPAAPEVILTVPKAEPTVTSLPAVEHSLATNDPLSLASADPLSQGDSLDQLLAKLAKAPPPESPQPPKLLEGLALLDESLAPPAVSPTEGVTQPQASPDTWGLAPTETPPLSADWSLVDSSPSLAAATEPTRIPDLLHIAETKTPDLTPEYQAPVQAAPPIKPAAQPSAYQSGSSLTDILGATIAPASSNGTHIAEGAPSLSAPSAPTTEQRQSPAAVNNGSILDTLIPPPLAENPAASQVFSVPAAEFTVKNGPQPEIASEWGFEGVQNLSTPELESFGADFGLVPPAANNWSPDNWGAEIRENSLSDTEHATNEWTLPEAAAPEHDHLDALAPPALDELAIDESEESWSEDDLLQESAQLNSSSNAYDLNHYDDPDEPDEAIELDNSWTDETAAADLDNLLSRLKKPQCDAHQPRPDEAPATSYAEVAPGPESAPQALDVSALFAGEFEDDDEPESYALTPEPEQHAYPTAAQTQAADLTLATENQQPDQLAHYTERLSDTAQVEPSQTHQQPEAQIHRPHKMEAGEEQMLRLKGNKSAPEQSILEALSAKFIAYPREDSPNTKASEDTPALKTPDKSPKPSESTPHTSSREQSLAAKIQPPSLSQALSNFEEETLLKETRFVRQSINNLVDRYFAQQEQDNSY